MQNIDWTMVSHAILVILILLGNIAQYLLSKQAQAQAAKVEQKLNVTYHVLTNGASLDEEVKKRALASEERFNQK